MKTTGKNKTIKIKGQLFEEHTDKVCFNVRHRAHIVDIRDAEFNESQKLLLESFDEYFQLIYQTVPAKFTPFSKVLDAISSCKTELPKTQTNYNQAQQVQAQSQGT